MPVIMPKKLAIIPYPYQNPTNILGSRFSRAWSDPGGGRRIIDIPTYSPQKIRQSKREDTKLLKVTDIITTKQPPK